MKTDSSISFRALQSRAYQALKYNVFKNVLEKNQFIPKFSKTVLPYSCELMGQFLQIFSSTFLKKQTLALSKSKDGFLLPLFEKYSPVFTLVGHLFL